jgi:hypothetical protein
MAQRYLRFCRPSHRTHNRKEGSVFRNICIGTHCPCGLQNWPWLLRASLHIVASNVLSFEMHSEIGPAELLFPLPICKEQEEDIVLGFPTAFLTTLQTRALLVVVVACEEYSIIQDGARENRASRSQPPSNLSTTRDDSDTPLY